MAILGTMFIWFGWLGFNGGSTLGATDRIPMILANTMLAAVAGLLTALIVGWSLRRRADVVLIMNGALAGLWLPSRQDATPSAPSVRLQLVPSAAS